MEKTGTGVEDYKAVTGHSQGGPRADEAGLGARDYNGGRCEDFYDSVGYDVGGGHTKTSHSKGQ